LNDIIVGLDLGTCAVRAVIGLVIQHEDDTSIDIIGTAEIPADGLRNGVIVNTEKTQNCIKTVIEMAEQQAGYEVYSCITGIGGMQIESINTKGMVAISSHGRGPREITRADVERVLDAANAVKFPMDREILHIIPQQYIVDGMPGYKDPINMMAVRLDAEAHIVTSSCSAIKNIGICVTRAGFRLDRVMLKTLACAKAVMYNEEKELGSILIDLGGGTTDVLVILHDAPVCTASVRIGGKVVTNDISIVKGIPGAIAEKIKLESGCCYLPLLEKEEEVLIPGIAGRSPEQTTRTELAEIIQPRMEEILAMVREEIIRKTNITELAGNIVLTGGGANMEGIVELTKTVFNTSSVRIGNPGKFGGIEESYCNPQFATAVGLVMANKDIAQGKTTRREKKHREMESGNADNPSVWQKFKKMFF